MREKNSDSSFWKLAAFASLVVVIAILAYELGRGRQPVPSRAAIPPEATEVSEVKPAEPSIVPEPTPLYADFTFPVMTPALAAAAESALPAAPTAKPAPALLEEESREDPETCLTVAAAPNRVEAYGRSGPAVQLAVRARNRCGRTFSGRHIYFRVYATAPSGFDLSSATGRFDGTIPAWGSAETLIALDCDPTRVARYRIELLP